MIDFIILIGTVFCVLCAVAVVLVAFKFHRLSNSFVQAAERRAEAKKNPYTSVDLQFLVDSGMTPEQIKQAVKNAVEKL